eukprot:SAG11_NODE_335_length_10564_cov_23.976015_11_plen_63_part_00
MYLGSPVSISMYFCRGVEFFRISGPVSISMYFCRGVEFFRISGRSLAQTREREEIYAYTKIT